mgnify:FL=1
MAKRYEFAEKNSGPTITKDVCDGLAKQLGQGKANHSSYKKYWRHGCFLSTNGNVYYNSDTTSTGTNGIGVVGASKTKKWLDVDRKKSTYEYLMPADAWWKANGNTKYHKATEKECRDLQLLMGRGDKLTIGKGSQYYWKKGCVMNGNRVYWNPCDYNTSKSKICGAHNDGWNVYMKGKAVAKSPSSSSSSAHPHSSSSSSSAQPHSSSAQSHSRSSNSSSKRSVASKGGKSPSSGLGGGWIALIVFLVLALGLGTLRAYKRVIDSQQN